MSLQAIVDNLLSDTVQVSLPLFLPELILCATIVLLLLVRVFNRVDFPVLGRPTRVTNPDRKLMRWGDAWPTFRFQPGRQKQAGG